MISHELLIDCVKIRQTLFALGFETNTHMTNQAVKEAVEELTRIMGAVLSELEDMQKPEGDPS